MAKVSPGPSIHFDYKKIIPIVDYVFLRFFVSSEETKTLRGKGALHIVTSYAQSRQQGTFEVTKPSSTM
jgi:hypothetical protein